MPRIDVLVIALDLGRSYQMPYGTVALMPGS